MHNKYKVSLLRLNLLLAALLPALLVPYARDHSEAMLLGLAAAWLAISATLVEFSHRRPPLIPWQLLPSLLLGALLWSSADRYPFLLWAWAALIILPQPAWMAAINVLLASLSLAWVARQLPIEQAMTAGLVLAPMLLLGLIRTRRLTPLFAQAKGRVSLVPGERLWPRARLAGDLAREQGRAQRDGTHAELVLLRTRRRHLWSVARQLCEMTRGFEHCYRLDKRTLGALLISRDAALATPRRQQLLERLSEVERARVVALPHARSLAEELRALERQKLPITLTPGTLIHADA
ncbi:hypothetical protein [Halomonas icarae]|uniref:GGDEF domain-containing protein n=1 Tax=Halomonas icarae TaxID=2691040 RepID=A0A7X4VWA9_9GAMM|nr:hypothetical protein [Halomonas icarae]MDR5901235.1 hypothetical protein [Halomonas icarae]NAW11512.1 hypothetical protein [Halomonas icarae]